MISLTKMNKILGYDKENFVVKIQSGVLLNDLAQDAEKQGLLYPPDPGEKFATVGGNVADMDGSEDIQPQHIAEAIQYRAVNLGNR